MTKMSDKFKADRPREKLQSKGASALSELELLMAIIGSGNAQADVTTIARRTKKLLEQHGLDISYEQLQQVSGLGSARISEILATLELGKRYAVDPESPIIDSPEKAVEQLADIRNKKQEYFVCLTLDGANRLIAKRTISIGTLTSSLVHPREVFADAITDRAASIIVAHNHPSGNLRQSGADTLVTERLREAGAILGITLTYHIIITTREFNVIG